MSVQLFTAW